MVEFVVYISIDITKRRISLYIYGWSYLYILIYVYIVDIYVIMYILRYTYSPCNI
jgi:hypothetical protein